MAAGSEARVRITAETTDFQRNVTRATAALRDFSGAAAGTFTGFGTGAATIAAIGAGMALVARNAINMADNISKAAQKTGASTESLSALRVAAELSDVSFEELQGGLFRLAKAMAAGLDPGSEQAAMFQRMGVAVTDANGKLRTTDAVFADISEVFAKLPDGAQKTALAIELFGKSGADLIPLLNGGKAGIEAFRLEAERLGVVISSQDGKDAEAFNDSLTRMGLAAEGAGTKIASGLLPSLNQLTAAFSSTAQQSEHLRAVGSAIGFVFKSLAFVAVFLKESLLGTGSYITSVAVAVGAVLTGNFAYAKEVMAAAGKDIGASGKRIGDTFKALSEDVKREIPETTKTVQDSAVKSASAMKQQQKAAKESADAQIKDTQRLRDAVRKAAEESLAEAKKFAEEAKKLRESADDRQQSRKEQADEKRASTLSEDDQDLRNIQKTRELGNEADRLSGQAFLDALAGKTDEAAKKSEQSLKLAEKAAGFADRIKNADLAADLLDQIGEIEGYATNVQATIAQQKSDAATAQAQAQFKLADDLTAKLDALRAAAGSVPVGLDTAGAESQLAALREQVAQPITIPVNVAGAAAPEIQSNAAGGLIRGPGSDTSDNLLSWLSPGEYVVKAAAVRKYGPGFLAALNNMRLPAFASGGLVSRLSMPGLPAGGRGGSSMAPVTFNFPGLGNFDASMQADPLASLKTAFAREALRKGRR